MLGWANHIKHTRSTQRGYHSKHRPPCQYGTPCFGQCGRADGKVKKSPRQEGC